MTEMAAGPSGAMSKWTAAMAALTPSVMASALGGLVTTPNIPTWYVTLQKPWFNPPNWIFGPVWTILYLFIAYAFFRILRRPPGTPGRTAAILVFLGHMVLNTGWSFAFFGAHSPALGLAVIVLLWAGIVLTILLFARLDRWAAWLLAPYLAWVSFALVLNASIWRLNG